MQANKDKLKLEFLVNTFNSSTTAEDFIGAIQEAAIELNASEAAAKSSGDLEAAEHAPTEFSAKDKETFTKCFDAMSAKFPEKGIEVGQLAEALKDRNFYEQVKDTLKLIANWLGEKLGKEWYKEEAQEIRVRKSFKDFAQAKTDAKELPSRE
jgi:hypothetical protein